MGSGAGVVQRRENARRSTFLNKVAHNFVIEVFDRRPINLLSNILLLLGLERKLNENLLQLLVDVIDAELLKGVVLKKARSAVGQTSSQLSLFTSKISNPKISLRSLSATSRTQKDEL